MSPTNDVLCRSRICNPWVRFFLWTLSDADLCLSGGTSPCSKSYTTALLLVPDQCIVRKKTRRANFHTRIYSAHQSPQKRAGFTVTCWATSSSLARITRAQLLSCSPSSHRHVNDPIRQRTKFGHSHCCVDELLAPSLHMAYNTRPPWQAGFSVADLVFFGFLVAVGVPGAGYLVQTNIEILIFSLIVLDPLIFGTQVGSCRITYGGFVFSRPKRGLPMGKRMVSAYPPAIRLCPIVQLICNSNNNPIIRQYGRYIYIYIYIYI